MPTKEKRVKKLFQVVLIGGMGLVGLASVFVHPFGAVKSRTSNASLFAGASVDPSVVRIVESDDDLLRTVEATPGAVGILDVYAINSTVKVLRVDGKLPFDVGYALKGN